MTELELKSCHEVIDTVDVANIESIFYGKPTDPDILTVVMKDGRRLYCDEICPLQEEPVSIIWHDVSEEPKPNMELICVGQYGNPLVLSSNSDSFKSRDISKWAYFNDLLNFSNVMKVIK